MKIEYVNQLKKQFICQEKNKYCQGLDEIPCLSNWLQIEVCKINLEIKKSKKLNDHVSNILKQ